VVNNGHLLAISRYPLPAGG